MRVKLALTALLLSSLLMIHGCGPNADKVPSFKVTTESLTETACPAFAAADEAESRRTTERPAHWTKTGVQKVELQEHIDKLETAEVRKNSVIARMHREHEKCRGTNPKTS